MLDRRDKDWLDGCGLALVFGPLVLAALLFLLLDDPFQRANVLWFFGSMSLALAAGLSVFGLDRLVRGPLRVLRALPVEGKGTPALVSAPAERGEPRPLSGTTIQAREATVLCPFCKDSIDESVPHVACEKCATRHHPSCFLDNGGCAIFGCGEKRPRIVRPGVTDASC